MSSQIDVAPTVLGLLGTGYESQFYGRNILRMKKEEGRALISNYQRLGLYKDNKLSYLSPQQAEDAYFDPMGVHKPLEGEEKQAMIHENMAYYQSADYIWTHRLSRHD